MDKEEIPQKETVDEPKKRKNGKQADEASEKAVSPAKTPKGSKVKEPKAAAKHKTGPKQQSKAKAKAKAKAKTITKKPAAKDGQEDTQKTKVSKQDFASKALGWKEKSKDAPEDPGKDQEGHDSEEELGEDEDGAGEAVSKRDLGKARKFKKLSDAKAIPQHIVEAVEAAATRSEKTSLINGLFVRDQKGNLVMKPEQPVFEKAKVALHEKYGKEATVGKPWDVFLYESFGGSIAGCCVKWLGSDLDPGWSEVCRIQTDKGWCKESHK